jgi:hypothetical protein
VVSLILQPLYPWERGPFPLLVGGWMGVNISLYAVEKRNILHYWETILTPKLCSPDLIKGTFNDFS